MEKVENILETLMKEYSETEKVLYDRLQKSPDGALVIQRNKDGIGYYLKSENETRKYISKNNKDYIAQLAQKSYDKKLFDYVSKCKKLIENFLKTYKDETFDNIYSKLSEERRKLVTPIKEPLVLQVQSWIEEEYEKKEFFEEMPCILTERGERVRSKSEKILADKFFMHNIPYKYECPLYLKGYGTVYPDFTMINVKSGKIYYWEHFGMMDNSEYSAKAIKKIETYEKNGIFPGEQLLMTFETQMDGLNMGVVGDFIKRYFT